MRTITLVICIVLLLTGTIGVGLIHGQMTNSWKESPTSRIAGERLKAAVPRDFGAWRFEHQDEFSPEVLRILGQPACFSRVYQHVQTGDTITVAVIAGQPGPVSVHTPEICYSSRDYALAGQRTKAEIAGVDGAH